MNRAQQRAAALRQELDLRGRVDAEAVAVGLGLEVRPWPLEVLKELQVEPGGLEQTHPLCVGLG